jgi:hypothetical protein
VNGFPVPGTGRSVVAVAAPGTGPQRWAGASSAALDDDGTFVLAYRLRVTNDDVAQTVVARSDDGERFETVCTLDKSRFNAMSVERPALVRTDEGRWRIYVCSATPASKHWWIDMLEADDPEGFAHAEPTPVFPGTTPSPSRIRSFNAVTAAGTPGSAAIRSTSRTRRTA